MNLPVASVRDLAVHDNDLSVATHGRSFWILDDIGPLRDASAKVSTEDAYLFRPVNGMRIRPGDDQGTPYPADIPHGDNPPDGAIIDYYLKSDATTPVVLEVLDAKGVVVRRFASDDKAPQVEEKSLVVTLDWVKQPRVLSAKAGMHRWVWDVHYAAPTGAVQRRRGGGGNWATPGPYTVRLTANGKTYSQPLNIVMDPRVKVPEADLAAQFEASQRAAGSIESLAKPSALASDIAKQLKTLQPKLKGNNEAEAAVAEFQKKFDGVVGPPPPDYGTPVIPVQTDHTSVRYLQGALRQVQGALQSADAPPTPDQLTALTALEGQSKTTLAQWQQLLTTDLANLNAKLQQAGLPAINSGK
jgi:hypothetical protein